MTQQALLPVTRRSVLGTGIAAAGLAAAALPATASTPVAPRTGLNSAGGFWPNGARIAVSLSLMFEAGGQPISGAASPIADPIQNGLPDLPANGFFQYGIYEGIPRILDLMDKHQIKLSSFMVGEAIRKAPDLAQEIVRRGHEAGAHGDMWRNSYTLDPEAEKRFIAEGAESVHKITGFNPVGWNAYWLRNSPHTLDILKSLGFLYHIDEPSADQPFIVKLKGGDFVTVPYTLHMNDISAYPFTGWDPAAYEQALKDEFDQLYEEGATKRRMMVISMHDRMAGHANRVRVMDRFLTYAKSKPGVWFARKDEIAQWALTRREHTPVYDRGIPKVTGLPGSAA